MTPKQLRRRPRFRRESCDTFAERKATMYSGRRSAAAGLEARSASCAVPSWPSHTSTPPACNTSSALGPTCPVITASTPRSSMRWLVSTPAAASEAALAELSKGWQRCAARRQSKTVEHARNGDPPGIPIRRLLPKWRLSCHTLSVNGHKDSTRRPTHLPDKLAPTGAAPGPVPPQSPVPLALQTAFAPLAHTASNHHLGLLAAQPAR